MELIARSLEGFTVRQLCDILEQHAQKGQKLEVETFGTVYEILIPADVMSPVKLKGKAQ